MPRKRIIVAVEGESTERLPEVVHRLREAGMVVEYELRETGVVTGSIEDHNLERLREIDGVAAVEEEAAYRLPPPESDIQ